ncbi:MAG: hypothetical protein CME69_06705 [Halobacteriovorax sp.]|nr:hypothetical protein [Halobacteriovorax sp.]
MNSLFMLLPEKLQGLILRKLIKVDLPKNKYKKVIYKVAETLDEKEQAYRLVRNSYLKTNIEVLNNSDINLNKYFLLPSTTTFIAVYEGEVIGTVSQVLDVGLGLPIDDFTDIKDIRDSNARVCELTSLAIHERWRGGHRIFFPLVFFAVYYCYKNIGIDSIVSVTDLKGGIIMRQLFGFEKLSTDATYFHKAKSKKSTAQILNLHKLKNYFKTHFKSPNITRNLYQLYFKSPWFDQWDVPEKLYPLACERIFSVEEFNYFFKEKSNMYYLLNQIEKRVLENQIYREREVFRVQTEEINTRQYDRFIVNMRGSLTRDGDDIEVKVLDLAQYGMQIYLGEDEAQFFQIDDDIKGYLKLNDKITLNFFAKVQWIHLNRIGVRFVYSDKEKLDDFLRYANDYSYERCKLLDNKAS